MGRRSAWSWEAWVHSQLCPPLDLTFPSVKWYRRPSLSESLLAPTLLQEEAEALLELQGRLQEAQDTTEALRAQVGMGPRDPWLRGEAGWGAGRGLSEAGPGKCLFPQ